MKYILLILLATVSLTSQAQNKAEATFETKSLMLKDMAEGDKVTVTYYFSNTGSANLNLYRAKTTCGCTVAQIPTYDIKPGQQDSIVATFDSSNKPGYNAKGINIDSNVGEINLVFQVKVLPGKNSDMKLEPAHNHDHGDHSGHNH